MSRLYDVNFLRSAASFINAQDQGGHREQHPRGGEDQGVQRAGPGGQTGPGLGGERRGGFAIGS